MCHVTKRNAVMMQDPMMHDRSKTYCYTVYDREFKSSFAFVYLFVCLLTVNVHTVNHHLQVFLPWVLAQGAHGISKFFSGDETTTVLVKVLKCISVF